MVLKNRMTDDESVNQIFTYETGRTIDICVSPIHLILGTFGNTMIIFTYIRLRIKCSVFPIYFVSLAVSEGLVLYVLVLPRWIQATYQTDIYTLNNALCKLGIWFEFVFATLSTWILSLMSVHRASFAMRPHHTIIFCTSERTIAIIGVLLLVSVLLHSRELIWREVTAGECLFTGNATDNFAPSSAGNITIMNFSSMYIVPSILVIVSNGVLLKTYLDKSGTASVSSCASSPSPAKHVHFTERFMSLRMTILVMSIAFFVLVSPYFVTGIVLFARGYNFRVFETPKYVRQKGDDTSVLLLLDVSRHLYYFHAVVNCYVYILVGERFRAEFSRVIRCKQKRRLVSTATFPMTVYPNVRSRVVVPINLLSSGNAMLTDSGTSLRGHIEID